MVEPPKPKTAGRKRVKKVPKLSESEKKARQSALHLLRAEKEKLEDAKQKVDLAEKRLENKKEKLKELDSVLEGEKAVIDEQQIEEATPSIQEALKEREVIFQPNSGPQTEFLASSEREVFYGGARGGGKSYAMLVDPLRYCHKNAHRALLIRRTMPELRDLINHSQQLYSKAYPGAKWREQEKNRGFHLGQE